MKKWKHLSQILDNFFELITLETKSAAFSTRLYSSLLKNTPQDILFKKNLNPRITPRYLVNTSSNYDTKKDLFIAEINVRKKDQLIYDDLFSLPSGFEFKSFHDSRFAFLKVHRVLFCESLFFIISWKECLAFLLEILIGWMIWCIWTLIKYVIENQNYLHNC